MSAEYPDEFPYEARQIEPLKIWRKTCTWCSSSCEWPQRWGIFIGGRHHFTLYSDGTKPLILCSPKCVCQYFWKFYCVNRLRGGL